MSEASAATGPDADLAGGIGRRLAAHRARRGIRVAELAREVGVTPSLISQIERGQSRPSVSTLFAFARALDVPVDAFFREGEPAAEGGPPPAAPPAPGEPAVGVSRAGEPVAGVPAAGVSRAGGPVAGVPAAGVSRAGEPVAGEPGAGEPVPGAGEPEAAPAGPGAGRYVVRRDGRAAIDIDGGVRWERLTRTTLDHLDFFELIYEPGAQSHPLPYTHPGTEMVLVTSGRLEITVGFESYLLEPGDSMDFPSTMPHRYVNPGQQTARAVTAILYDCPGGAGPGRRAGHAP